MTTAIARSAACAGIGVALLLAASVATAQPLRNDGWGFAFVAPTGWQVVDQSAEGAVLFSADLGAYPLIEPHQFESREVLALAAGRGYQNTGVRLSPAGEVAEHGEGVALEMEGVVEGQPARAYAIGLLSPYGGGAIVLMAVAQAQWDAAFVPRVERIATTFEFFDPATTTTVASAGDTDWTSKLAGHCVAYMSSSGGGGNAVGGFATGTYASDRAKLYLDPDGRFQSGASHSASFDAGVSFGNVATNSGLRQGTWSIVAEGGSSTLRLQYEDGSLGGYTLTTNERGHTFLDGDRWFVVSYQECEDI